MQPTLAVKLLAVPTQLTMAERDKFKVGVEVTNRGKIAVDPHLSTGCELTVNGDPSMVWNLAIGNGTREPSWYSLPPGQTATMSWPLGEDLFPKPGDYHLVMTLVPVWAIFGLSWNLLSGYTGLISFGHAAFFGLGAYAVAILGTLFGVNAWLGLAAGVAVAAAGAALIGFFCVRTSGIPFLMLTLAFSQLVFSVALKWRDVTGGSDGMAIAEKPALFGFELSDSLAMYFVTLVFFLLSYWGLRRLLNAPLGHVFVGIRENEPRMLAIGYPTRAYKLLSFTIAGAFAGLAGGLYAIFNSFISPDAIYWTSSGDILIMTMLGGAGTLIGPAIGAGVFLLMKNVVSSYSEHWLAIIGIIFICCVMFFPGGIWGTLRQLRLRRRKP